jgi:hypothetical protein
LTIASTAAEFADEILAERGEFSPSSLGGWARASDAATEKAAANKAKRKTQRMGYLLEYYLPAGFGLIGGRTTDDDIEAGRQLADLRALDRLEIDQD